MPSCIVISISVLILCFSQVPLPEKERVCVVYWYRLSANSKRCRLLWASRNKNEDVLRRCKCVCSGNAHGLPVGVVPNKMSLLIPPLIAQDAAAQNPLPLTLKCRSIEYTATAACSQHTVRVCTSAQKPGTDFPKISYSDCNVKYARGTENVLVGGTLLTRQYLMRVSVSVSACDRSHAADKL